MITTETLAHARSRQVEQHVTGQSTSDGAGVKLTRVLTADLQQRLDPFLLLDEFRSGKSAQVRCDTSGNS